MTDHKRPPPLQATRPDPARPSSSVIPLGDGATLAPVAALDDVNAPTALHPAGVHPATAARGADRVRLASAQWSADPSAASSTAASDVDGADPTERVMRPEGVRPRAVELLDSGVFARPAGSLGDGVSVDRRDDDDAGLQATDPVRARPAPRNAPESGDAGPVPRPAGLMEAPTAEVRPDASTVLRWPAEAHEVSVSVIQAVQVEHGEHPPIHARDVEPDTLTDRDRLAPLDEKLGRAVELVDTLGVLLQGLPQPQRAASAHIHRELRLRLVEAQALLLRR